MPSSTENGKEGIVDDRDCNTGSQGRETKRLKLDVQSSTDDDSGHNSDEYSGGGDDYDMTEFNSQPILKDERTLAERCFGPPFKYWIHDPEATYQKMVACVSDVSNQNRHPPEVLIRVSFPSLLQCQKVLPHSSTTVRILLNHRNWDTGKLYDSYYESDLSTMFKAAGLMDPDIALPAIHNLAPPSQCNICFSSLRPQVFLIPLGCSFLFHSIRFSYA